MCLPFYTLYSLCHVCVRINHLHTDNDVEQIAHAFLEQQGHQKSQRKIKEGC